MFSSSFGSSATGGSAHNEIGTGRTGTGTLSAFIFRAGPESAFQRPGSQP